eukprot:04196.XXX_10835_10165_1 [CDS] Oithona nana genome sequencing.
MWNEQMQLLNSRTEVDASSLLHYGYTTPTTLHMQPKMCTTSAKAWKVKVAIFK